MDRLGTKGTSFRDKTPSEKTYNLPHWASRALGCGEEESQTEYGRLGKATLQGGAVLEMPVALLPLLGACRLALCDAILPVHASGQGTLSC